MNRLKVAYRNTCEFVTVLRWLPVVAVDASRKPFFSMLGEFAHLWLRDRAVPSHYFVHLLYQDNVSLDMKYHVGRVNTYRAFISVFDPVLDTVLRNKVLFSLILEGTGVELPRTLGYNIKQHFYTGGSVEIVAETEQLERFLNGLVQGSSTGLVFAKPTMGGQGKGCFVFDGSTIPAVCSESAVHILNNDYVYQEAISQHPMMAALHPSSVNTLRIATYQDETGQVHIMSAFVRMGVGGSVVDNVGSGGCFVGIDMSKGTLLERGFVSPGPGPGFRIIERHPDTGLIFKGLQIPFFFDALAVAREAATRIPVTTAGWDVAIGREGPILIEGNQIYGTTGAEMACGGYWQNPIFRMLISERVPKMNRILHKLPPSL
jgi:hypothetical protein